MRDCEVLRVFTRDGSGGNHLGVIRDLTDLTGERMQWIAADLGFSETVFLDWTGGTVATARIFTPARELPFAGHPLVGAAWALSRGASEAPYGIRCGIGDVVIGTDGENTWIEPPFDQEATSPTVDASGWVEAVHQSTVLMPLPYLVVETDSVERVASLSPPPWADSVYVWAWDTRDELARARFFAGEHGVTEDPATGSAAVALAASLRARGTGSADLVIHQGEEIGHPSRIHLGWEGNRVRVAGTVAHDERRVLSA